VSTIAGQGLFNSGPHRFRLRPVGTLAVPPLVLDSVQTTTAILDEIEVALEQTGRLIDTTPAGLWDQVEAIRAAAESRLNGTLIDETGRSWSDMTLLRFAMAGQLCRGRVVSVGYEAVYVRLA
jgi:hypothetical protein